VPIAVGSARATQPAETFLLEGSTVIPAGACGDAVKVNFGDAGYYRVEYGPDSRAALAKSLALMAPSDRVNFIADSWALVQAGRAEPPSYLALVEQIGRDDHRAVWDQVIGTFTALDRLARDRTERPALRRYARARLRPVFDRLGWDASANDGADDDSALLRSSLIRLLGEFGDEDILAEARRRFAGFLQDPSSLPNALRDAVTHLVGLTADRASYDTLLALARKTTVTGRKRPGRRACTRDAGAHPDRRVADHDRWQRGQHGRLLRRAAGSGLGLREGELRCPGGQTGIFLPRQLRRQLHDQLQRRRPCRRACALCSGAGDLRWPRDDGTGAGNHCDLDRPQDARAAGDRCLDQGAQ
jgi:hypothetical protein